MSVSKKHRKLITSLQQKKYRIKYKLFVAEGIKVVSEFLNSSFELDTLFTTGKEHFQVEEKKMVFVGENELKQISRSQSPNAVLGLFKIPDTVNSKNTGLTLVLDGVNDPGNLGTIIRLCDWFGIADLVCSTNTVDCYNFKVVQASMGSLKRVQLHYTDIADYLAVSERPVFIADIKGENIYESAFPEEAILIMGSEANGVSEKIKERVKNSIAIPGFGGSIRQTESLNVATAAAILVSEFRRQITQK
ncbi:MAG: RNA methyltransferase [Flavobacteriaceae bacterium]|nr:MAG: RNA methyltransferase [Flavobacteriaceae bacterium]